MKKPYVVVVDEGFPRKNLLEQMERDARFGSWFYSMPNSFIVYSTADANAIDAFIKENIGDKYRYFITEIADVNRQGWMPRQHWSLIYQRGAEKLFDLDFQGYYTDAGKIPELSGVFCVYCCLYTAAQNSVVIKDLLYVGSASNVRVGVQEAIEQNALLMDCSGQETLCYSFTEVQEVDLEWCVTALRKITDYKHKDKNQIQFVYNDAFVRTHGQNSGLPTEQLVEKQIDGRG